MLADFIHVFRLALRALGNAFRRSGGCTTARMLHIDWTDCREPSPTAIERFSLNFNWRQVIIGNCGCALVPRRLRPSDYDVRPVPRPNSSRRGGGLSGLTVPERGGGGGLRWLLEPVASPRSAETLTSAPASACRRCGGRSPPSSSATAPRTASRKRRGSAWNRRYPIHRSSRP